MYNAIHKARIIDAAILFLAVSVMMIVFTATMFYYIMESNYMKQYDPKIHTGIQKGH